MTTGDRPEDTPPYGVRILPSRADRPLAGGEGTQDWAAEDRGTEDWTWVAEDRATEDRGTEDWGTEDWDGRADGESPGAERPRAERPRRGGAHRATARHRATKEEDDPQVRRRRRRRRWIVLGAVAVIVLLVVGAYMWVEAEASPSGPQGKAVVVDVKPGEATDAVVGVLANHGVVHSSLAFRLWSFVHGQPTVEPGRYQFKQNSSFAAVDALLNAGPNVFGLKVVAGTTLSEVANQLATLRGNLAQTFLQDAKSGAVPSPYQTRPGGSLEGLIAPGRYQITPHEGARTLLHKMVGRFDSEAAAAGLSPGTSVNGLSAYDVVIVASIAQKEGYYTRYMGDVARVVYNRLADGMHLDMTSTVLYSLGQDGGRVTPKDEAITNPYNTYLRSGLTPTPICTPSKTAIAAAVSPPSGPWRYFELVTAKKGDMVFSATYTGQITAERQAAANAAAARGSASGGSGSGT